MFGLTAETLTLRTFRRLTNPSEEGARKRMHWEEEQHRGAVTPACGQVTASRGPTPEAGRAARQTLRIVAPELLESCGGSAVR